MKKHDLIFFGTLKMKKVKASVINNDLKDAGPNMVDQASKIKSLRLFPWLYIPTPTVWNVLARITAHPNTIRFRMCLPEKVCVTL